jgi:stearoyl-CoA desaturase (delta-9 desaturase)
MYFLSGLAISGGYHRYYAHRAYKCHRAVQLFYALFGAAALQAPVLDWVAEHRDHHRFVDQVRDPYCIKRGFFWAHMGWIIHQAPAYRADLAAAPDLVDDPLLIFQKKHYRTLALLVGFGLPFLLGGFWGRPVGAVIWGGLLRLAVSHHCAFLVNSAAHTFGTQPYSSENTSRDNWIVALVTMGEGYHNFHHAYPMDFRNGVFWYQWDPTKWLILALRTVGLAWDLKQIPLSRIRAHLSRPGRVGTAGR